MDFCEAEKQILIAVKWISKNKAVDRKILDERKEDIFGKELVPWNGVLDELIKKEIVRETGGSLTIAEHIEEEVKRILAEWTSRGFSEWMIKSEQSKAYSLFCERLYGKDLCQCSMMNMAQFDKMIELLMVDENCKMLDLGCGIGTVTEYLSDITKARVTGIDIASEAIKRARERTQKKSNRLIFEVQNMDEINFPPRSFDTIISIDTMYFVNDLETVIAKCKQMLVPGGQICIFFTQVIGAEDTREILQPDHTKLANALLKQKLKYRTWDYTEDEYRHWRRGKEIAEELKSAFEDEGNIELYESRIKESEELLKAVNDGRISRYLYHVTL